MATGLAYNQMTNNLTSQAATMELHGIPNDILSNLNPLSLIIFIPIVDQWVYPALRKAKINFTPLKRITMGFMMGCLAMIWACVTQYYVYQKNPCGDHANTCKDQPAPINVWVQTGAYSKLSFP
jgi:POT family proton-dependent oligopeptide transporter